MKTTFFCILLLTIKMIVFVCWQEKDVDKSCLVVEKVKFAKHIMVSAGLSHGSERKLLFISDKAKS